MYHKDIISLIAITILLSIFCLLDTTNAARCFQCRSRGEYGSCKDPFNFNATDVQDEPGLSVIPCASGWCGKVIEGGGAYAADDYDQAIQRMCVQRGPDDNEERCAYTVFNYKKAYMCFCRSDLCNAAPSSNTFNWFSLTSACVLGCLGLILAGPLKVNSYL